MSVRDAVDLLEALVSEGYDRQGCTDFCHVLMLRDSLCDKREDIT
jgi:hypothetical protein